MIFVGVYTELEKEEVDKKEEYQNWRRKLFLISYQLASFFYSENSVKFYEGASSEIFRRKDDAISLHQGRVSRINTKNKYDKFESL